MPSICVAMNVFNEALALPGALENAKQWADSIFVLHAGPSAKYSTDGTIEILEASGVKFKFCDVLDGFGKIRTRLIHENKCDWTFVQDADERMFPTAPVFECTGSEKYPDTLTPDVHVRIVESGFNQGELLRRMCQECTGMAVRMCRRHWFQDPALWGSMKNEDYRPCQNFKTVPDFQLRCIRNDPKVFFLPERKLHEHLKWTPTWEEPPWSSGDQHHGPFYDHFSFWAKSNNTAKDKEDLETFRQMDASLTKGMWLEHRVAKAEEVES